MTWILWLLAAACVIYYVVIVIYSGFTTSFSFIWMVFAAACLLLALGWEYYMKHKDRVPLWLPVSVITFCCTGILVFSMVEILIFTGVASRDTSHLDYLIVLGARVKEDGLSKSLKSRLDKAIDYLEENPGTVLVLSGGQGQFFLQEAEHDTAFSCGKSSVMVYYEHLVRYSTNLAGSEL